MAPLTKVFSRRTDDSLTVLLLLPRTVSAEAEGCCRGHRAQDGRQRGGFSSGHGVVLWLRLLALLRSLLLQFEQSLQRQLLQVFAEKPGDGLELVVLLGGTLTGALRVWRRREAAGNGVEGRKRG